MAEGGRGLVLWGLTTWAGVHYCLLFCKLSHSMNVRESTLAAPPFCMSGTLATLHPQSSLNDPGLQESCPATALQVIEVNAELQTCRVTEGLTEDAVSARLHQGKPLHPAPLGQMQCRPCLTVGANVAEPL